MIFINYLKKGFASENVLRYNGVMYQLKTMTHILKKYSLLAAATGIQFMVGASRALALNDALGPIPEIGGNPNETSIRTTILTVLNTILTFLALFAVVMIVVAGIRYIFSGGEQEATDKAKKTIIYAVVGLLVVLLASAIVSFVVGVIDGSSSDA